MTSDDPIHDQEFGPVPYFPGFTETRMMLTPEQKRQDIERVIRRLTTESSPVAATAPTAGSEVSPVYKKVSHGDDWATQLYFIVCDEGWRESVVCQYMYDWAADWLIEVVQDRPYAPGRRP